MPGKAPVQPRKRANIVRVATPSDTALPPRLSSAHWKMLRITRPSKPPLSPTMTPSPRWNGNWCCGSRATSIETGLFEIQANHIDEFRQRRREASRDIVYAVFGRQGSLSFDRNLTSAGNSGATRETEDVPGTSPKPADPGADPVVQLSRCFLRLANLPNYALDRLSRYEAALWRQVGQTLFALDSLDRRKPQERTRQIPVHCAE
jgi:hypothetical protein